MENMNEKMCGTELGFCFCRALGAILIIVLVWTMPSWANIAITILAVLILLGSGGCACKGMKKKDEAPAQDE